jgi:hypothetical protein
MIGKVINIQDVEQKGRVQVRIYPELLDVPDSDLPWATPLIEQNIHHVPPLNSFVLVEVSEDWTLFKYSLITPFARSTYPYEEIKGIIGGNHTYPEPMAMKTEDGSVLFYDQKTGECGVVHSSGVKITVDKDKHVKIEGVSDIQLGGDDDSGVLYSALSTILDAVMTHTHITDCGAGAGTASASSSLAGLNISSIKSSKVKLI